MRPDGDGVWPVTWAGACAIGQSSAGMGWVCRLFLSCGSVCRRGILWQARLT